MAFITTPINSSKPIFLGKYQIIGNSIGNISTGLYIPQLKIQLDAGFSTGQTIQNIIITHGHADHIKNLTDIVHNNTTKINIICPNYLKQFLENYLQSYFQLTSLNLKNNKLSKLVEWNKEIKNIIIETFNVKHSVKCVAYGISQIVNKLKPEFNNKTSKELAEIKKTVPITLKQINHEILFATDLDYSSLKILPFNKYQNIIIECTFYYPEHLIEARKKLHLHWNDIKPIIEKYPLKNFLLIHSSPRYQTPVHITRINTITKSYKNLSQMWF